MLGLIIAAVGAFAGIATDYAFGPKIFGWIWFTLCALGFVLGIWWLLPLALAYGRLHVVMLYYPAR